MIELSHVRKTYNRSSSTAVTAINDTTLSFPETGMVAIFGKSGCGKTTLLNVIGGLDRYDAGEILVDGKPVNPNQTELRNRAIGYIFQNYNLSESRTVFENVADALRLCGMEDTKEIGVRVKTALSVVGLEKYQKRLPSTLSGGQQQRVAIARAIVKAPKVILADEPTGNLDDSNTIAVMSLLKKLSRTCLILLVTHEADLVDAFCDQVIEIVDGRVQSEYRNDVTDGVVRENRSDIYLGDLSGSDGEVGDIRVSAFSDGSAEQPLNLKVVIKNGTIFLDTGNDARVRVLTPGSEVRLLEGTREEALKKLEAERSAEARADISALTPFEGKRYGRLFTAGAAIRSAVQALFKKSQKKGRKFLNILLVVFAVLIVGQAAQFGTVIREFRKTRSAYTDESVFVRIPSTGSNAAMDKLIALEGVDTVFLTHSTQELVRNLTFETVSYETYTGSWMPTGPEATGIPMDIRYAGDLKLVAGKNTLSSDHGLIITTAIADQLMETSSYSFIRSYEDLLDLVTNFSRQQNLYMHIEGIVQSASNLLFVSSRTMVDLLIGSKQLYATLESLDSFRMEDLEIQFTGSKTDGLEKGTVLINTWNGFEPAFDGTVEILGRTFRIAGFYGPGVGKEQDEQGEWIDYGIYPGVVLHPDDYASLLYSVGPSDGRIGLTKDFYDYNGSSESVYAVLFTSEPGQVVERVRASGVAFDQLLTGQEMFWQDYGVMFQSEALSRVIVFAVFMIIMCLCVFLIMRANLMSQVREIGICRAIGASKRNLAFKYWVETMLLLSSTVLIGFFCSSLFYRFLGSQPLVGTLIYYPVWLAGIVIALLYLVGCLCGLIPVWGILRKTPCQILSKYDM